MLFPQLYHQFIFILHIVYGIYPFWQRVRHSSHLCHDEKSLDCQPWRNWAVYADSDVDALHVHACDEAWALPGTSAAHSYLNAEKLLDVARRSKADALHPGYGFLSERADFAQAVQDAGLIWIGPQPETIALLGDKVSARRLAAQLGAPLAAGTDGPVTSSAEVLAFAEQHGLPIAIKAAHGGGGRGLKVAWHMEELAELYESAVREAKAAFGRGECFVEQFLDRPRHIEAQILADQHGRVVVLGTRDCSLQRRNQKLVEEAPAPFLTDAQRQTIHQAAKDICTAASYSGAGTVEFLLSQSGQISFLEVNTRLQVEHPVTEETSGIDLVVEQLRIADGLPLSRPDNPPVCGHSIEFRINAEDPARGYLPTPGRISRFDAPSGPGVRVDSGVAAGSYVPGQFDSLLAKLIVTGSTRQQALARARRALQEFHIEGVASVLPFHRAVLEDAAFAGEHFAVHTRWIETELRAQFEPATRPEYDNIAAPLRRSFIELDGKRVQLGLPADWTLPRAADSAAAQEAATPASLGDVSAPLSGSLVSRHKGTGDMVQAGEAIGVMEAMKMETTLYASQAGRLEWRAELGEMVTTGQVVAKVG